MAIETGVGVPIVVRTADDLRALRASRRLDARNPIAFELPDLSAEQAESLAARVNGYRTECGCSLGAKGMAVAVVAVVAWLLLHPHGVAISLLVRVPIALLFILVGAGVGKALGIFVAHRKLRRVLDGLLGSPGLISRGG